MTPQEFLERALLSTDHNEQLTCLLETWRHVPAPELRSLIVSLSQAATMTLVPTTPHLEPDAWDVLERARRPLDLPALLAGMHGLKPAEVLRRYERLATWPDDPRLVDAAFGWISKPPARRVSPDSRAFWEAVLTSLRASVDPMICERELPRSMAMGADAVVYLRRQFRSIAPRPAVTLPPDLKPLVARLESSLRAVQTAGSSERGAVVKTEAEVLAAIAADPSSDAPRLVYADWLQARGDPWGEFIALQMASGQPSTRDKRTMEHLFEAHGEARFRGLPIEWKTRLKGNVQGVRIHRGFPVEAELSRDITLAPALGDPRWATLEIIHCGLHGFQSAEDISAFATDPAKGALRAVRDRPPVFAVALAKQRPPRLVELGISVHTDLGFLDELAAAAGPWLEALHFRLAMPALEVVRTLLAHPLVARVKRLTLEHGPWSGAWWVVTRDEGSVSSNARRALNPPDAAHFKEVIAMVEKSKSKSTSKEKPESAPAPTRVVLHKASKSGGSVWVAELRGTSWGVRYGRNGAKHQETEHRFETEAEARADFEKAIKAKRREYAEAPAIEVCAKLVRDRVGLTVDDSSGQLVITRAEPPAATPEKNIGRGDILVAVGSKQTRSQAVVRVGTLQELAVFVKSMPARGYLDVNVNRTNGSILYGGIQL